MSVQHDSYFEDSCQLVIEAFDEIEWENVLSESLHYDYSDLSHRLYIAAGKANEQNQEPHSRILQLLSEACSMRLSLEKLNYPFPHRPNHDGWRTTIPSDFTIPELEFMSQVLDSIKHPMLKGRLADLIWDQKKPREVKFALLAIDSYIQIPLDPDAWLLAGSRCWQRAINLCRMIGDSAGNRLNKIEASITKALMSANSKRGFYGHILAETILENKFAIDQQADIASKLETMAHEFDVGGNFHSAAGYFGASAMWFGLSGNKEKSVAMIVAKAMSHEKDADSRITSDNPSHLVAVDFLEKAVQTFRCIPHTYRERHQVDQRIQNLNQRIREFGQKAEDEMATFTTPGIDISNLAEESRASVSNKPAFEALMIFTSLHDIDVNEMRNATLKDLSKYVAPRVVGKVIYSHDGRVIRKIPPYVESASPEENKDAIRAHMYQFHYAIGVQVVVIGKILPALSVLNSEHPLSEADFIDLAKRSPVVPENREILWGKALTQGFNQDFVTALHLLSPQIENMVRCRLNSAGVGTIRADDDGIRQEIGLSALMDLPEADDVLGENLSYEIRTLFCDQIGANLRNNMCHGLFDDEHFCTVESVYAWWLGLKLVMNGIWESLLDSAEE